jgi:hypothetical protein
VVDPDAVEDGQPLQPWHRDAALAALVGAEDAGLELLAGALLDLVEGEALLQADVAEPFADLLRVAGHLGSSRADVMVSMTGEAGAAA